MAEVQPPGRARREAGNRGAAAVLLLTASLGPCSHGAVPSSGEEGLDRGFLTPVLGATGRVRAASQGTGRAVAGICIIPTSSDIPTPAPRSSSTPTTRR